MVFFSSDAQKIHFKAGPQPMPTKVEFHVGNEVFPGITADMAVLNPLYKSAVQREGSIWGGCWFSQQKLQVFPG